jgi:hypothetical protein
MKILICMVLALAASVAVAQTQEPVPQVTSVTVTEYGTYEYKSPTQEGTTANGTPHNTIKESVLLAQTRTVAIPAANNDQHIGFRYTLNGTPDGATVSVRLVLIYPVPITRDGKSFSQDEYTVQKTIGKSNVLAFTVNSNSPAGDHTLQLWHDNQLLTTQVFTVTR